MDKKELLFFEWVVIDNCNLNCSYCVNKGEYSQKRKEEMKYIPGLEIDIARKIVKISDFSDRLIVNLTGGEPLLAKNIGEVISILGAVPNIEIRLITNFKLIAKIQNFIPNLSSITVSLHIKHRNDNEVSDLVKSINEFKNMTSVSLSQVNYDLNIENRKKLAEISLRTGMDIHFQTFIPPWTEDGKIERAKEISDGSFVTSLGKRCSLGYTYFFLNPDGSFYYGLWCNEKTQKIGNFLSALSEIENVIFPDGLSKCLSSSCGCNYNLFEFEIYRSICKKLGYGENEIFGPKNTKFNKLVSGKLSFWMNKYFKIIRRFGPRFL